MTAFMHLASFLGGAAFYLPLLVLVFWCVNPRAAARMAVALALSAMLNVTLKLAFADPRPYWTDPGVQALEPESSFGMPSGHAQGAMVAWGFAAHLVGRRWGWAVAAVVVVLVGVSRVHLGVHSPGQVIAGWAIGAAVLVAVVRLEPVLAGWWCRRRVAAQLALSAAVALALLGCAALIVHVMLAGWLMPLSWRHAIIASGGTVDDIGLERAAMAAGLLCGVLAGLSWLADRGWFDPSGTLRQRAGRVPAGLGGLAPILLLWLALPVHPVTGFVAGALTGLWLTAGAPETFLRLGLARRSAPRLTQPGEPELTRDS